MQQGPAYVQQNRRWLDRCRLKRPMSRSAQFREADLRLLPVKSTEKINFRTATRYETAAVALQVKPAFDPTEDTTQP